MALDARTRSSIYGKLVPVLGDEDANALMSQFPAVEADELVTEHFLRAELSELRSGLRAEMTELRSGLRAEAAELRAETGDGFAHVHAEIADVRSEVAALRTGLAALRAEMADRFRQHTVWFGGALGASTALLAAIGLLA